MSTSITWVRSLAVDLAAEEDELGWPEDDEVVLFPLLAGVDATLRRVSVSDVTVVADEVD